MRIRIMCGCLMLWLITAKVVRADIVMTEVYPAPSTGYEWVELCNTGSESVALGEYTLADSSGKKLYIPSITLAPQQYILATSSGVLNNSGDSVSLSKSGIILQDMLYNFSVTSEYSLVSCDQTWAKTLLITPGFENVPCASPPHTLSSPTPNPTTSFSSSTAPAPVSSTTLTPSSSPSPSRATPLVTRVPTSFQQHHAPRVLAATSTPPLTPTPSPTTNHDSDIHIAPDTSQSPYSGIGLLLLAGGVVSSLLLLHNIALRMKSAYNNDHESEGEPP